MILSCSARVGSPHGLLEIWREHNSSRFRELLGSTSAVYRDIESCVSTANLTVTYNVTRQDNRARFKCLSRNEYSQEPFPAVDYGPVNILCKLTFLCDENFEKVYSVSSKFIGKCLF